MNKVILLGENIKTKQQIVFEVVNGKVKVIPASDGLNAIAFDDPRPTPYYSEFFMGMFNCLDRPN